MIINKCLLDVYLRKGIVLGSLPPVKIGDIGLLSLGLDMVKDAINKHPRGPGGIRHPGQVALTW